jgi:hypothetical protein
MLGYLKHLAKYIRDITVPLQMWVVVFTEEITNEVIIHRIKSCQA